MRRGDLCRYVRPSSPEVPRIVVILSGDSVNSSPRPWVLGMELQQRDPGDILAIPVAHHGCGLNIGVQLKLQRPGRRGGLPRDADSACGS